MAGTGTIENASTGELVARLSQDLSTLMRDELRLAQAETSEKAKKVGVGIGLFGSGGMLALYGMGALVAAAILGLSNVVRPWLAALIIGAALLVVAAAATLIGKKDLSEGAPPMPDEAIAGVKTDVQTLREGARR